MKKLLSLILIAILSLSSFISVCADDEIYTDGAFKYIVVDDEACIVEYFGEDSEIVIPAQVGGIPIRRIMNNAFAKADQVTKISIPEGLLIEDETLDDVSIVEYVVKSDMDGRIKEEVKNKENNATKADDANVEDSDENKTEVKKKENIDKSEKQEETVQEEKDEQVSEEKTIEEKNKTGDTAEEDIAEEESGHSFILYIVMILISAILFIFFILLKRRKDEEE